MKLFTGPNPPVLFCILLLPSPNHFRPTSMKMVNKMSSHNLKLSPACSWWCAMFIFFNPSGFACILKVQSWSHLTKHVYHDPTYKIKVWNSCLLKLKHCFITYTCFKWFQINPQLYPWSVCCVPWFCDAFCSFLFIDKQREALLRASDFTSRLNFTHLQFALHFIWR